MAKRVTTSAQKTVAMPKSVALQQLRTAIAAQESVQFRRTGNPDIVVAELSDGSRLHIAAFDKDNARAIAMIDHRNVDEASRTRWQRHWRQSLDTIFADNRS